MRKHQKKLPKAEREAYEKWCKQYGIDPTTNKPIASSKESFRPLVTKKHPRLSDKKLPSLDSGVKGAISSRSMMDPLNWKNESKETIEKIVAKSKSLVIMYNKGAYQPVTPGTDITEIGSAERIRRGG